MTDNNFFEVGRTYRYKESTHRSSTKKFVLVKIDNKRAYYRHPDGHVEDVRFERAIEALDKIE